MKHYLRIWLGLFALAIAMTLPTESLRADGGEEDVGSVATKSVELDPTVIPTEDFAGRAALMDAQLSPDGSKFAFVFHKEGNAFIAVIDADTRETIKVVDVANVANFKWYKWAGNDRIVFSNSRRIFFILFFFPKTELRVFDLNTDETHFVGFEEQGLIGDDILYIDPAGRYVNLAVSKTMKRDPGVYRFLLDGSGEDTAVEIQKPRKGIDAWWADSSGTVRLGMKLRGTKKVSFFYRSNPGGKLEHVAKVRTDRSEEVGAWDILGLRPGSDLGYALVEQENGRMVLREFDFSKGEAGKLLYENPDWDVEGIILDNDFNVIGATYTDDTRKVHWFDPEIAGLMKQLNAALGKGRTVVTSRSDNGRLLVWHGSAGDPGVLYVYTPERRSLDTYAQVRPDLDFNLLVEPQPINYVARDGTRIHGYLTLPEGQSIDLPLILLPHGGPYGIRDQLEYNDEVQFLANRGYAVLQPNFRGSGGYGRAFEELGNGTIGREMQDDLDDAMDWAVEQGIADRNRVCVVGGSYGGYAALWAVIRNPERYRCAASWAGVTDMGEQLKYDRDFFTRRAGKRWQRRVEGDDKDFDLDDVSPALQAARLSRPILLAHGKSDDTVKFRQFTLMKEALEEAGKPFDELVIEKEGHSFSKPESEKAWFDALEKFLAEHNPAD